jgi:hypothetical protein
MGYEPILLLPNITCHTNGVRAHFVTYYLILHAILMGYEPILLLTI